MAPDRQSAVLTEPPKGRFFIGHLPAFRRRLLETMTDWQRDYGDFIRFWLGPRTSYLVSHPALAEEISLQKPDVFMKVWDARKPTGLALVLSNGLLISLGVTWRRHRRIIQPVFHRSRIVAFSERMVLVGTRLLDRWSVRDPGQLVDVASEMMRTTLEIVTQTMSSTESVA